MDIGNIFNDLNFIIGIIIHHIFHLDINIQLNYFKIYILPIEIDGFINLIIHIIHSFINSYFSFNYLN